MKKPQLFRALAPTVLMAIFTCPVYPQDVICVDSSHYQPEVDCYLVYIPLCACNGADPGNDCFAFNDALSCWSQNCDLIDKGCEVAFSYSFEGDRLLLRDESPTAGGDEVEYWEWQNGYETFATESPEAVLELPPGENEFKISLRIRTMQGCIAYCTYLLDRGIDSTREPAGEEPTVFPNPVDEALHIRHTIGYRQLQVYSLDGRLQSERPLQGALLERVEMGQLPAGIYLVVLSGDKEPRIFKVVAQ